jgi:predicted HicB family RNase H-like nuclease
MAIAKKPKSNHGATTKLNTEQAAEAFISGAQEPKGAKKKEVKTPIMMRFDPTVLERVDAAAKRRGISRSAWIQFTVSRALDQGEG